MLINTKLGKYTIIDIIKILVNKKLTTPVRALNKPFKIALINLVHPIS